MMNSALVLIEYKDKKNWVTELEQKEVIWDDYSNKLKLERVQPHYVAPTIVTDIWNGKESDIQHVTHESYYFQMFIRESEIEFVQKLKSCSDIKITQKYVNESGLIVENEFILDTTKSDLLQISDPERASDTTGWKVDVIFATNRTVINKADPINFTNRITFSTSNNWQLIFEDQINGKIAKLDEFNIAALNSGSLQKYKRVGDSWVAIGNSKTIITHGSDSDIIGLDSNSVALVSSGQGILVKYTFSSSNWNQVGNSLDTAGLTSLPGIASFSSSRVVIWNEIAATLTAYDFDGTNWAQVGNSVITTSGSSTYIDAMSSTKLALYDVQVGLSSYDFDGVNFTIDQIIAYSSSGSGALCALSTTRVALINNNNDELRSYTLSGAWSQDAGSLSITGTSVTELVGLNSNELFATAGTSGNYTYGISQYFTDFSVLDWNKEVDDVIVDWWDGTQKIAQRINKNGLQAVFYLLNSEHDLFIEKLKESITTEINGIAITEVEFELIPEIAEDYYKIIVRGVKASGGTIVSTFLDKLDGTYTLAGISPVWSYTTGWFPQFITEDPINNTTSNLTGINTPTKTITKIIKQIKFYRNRSDIFDIKKDFEKWGTIELNDGTGAVAVKEMRPANPEEIGIDLYELAIDCLIDTETI